MYVHITCYRYYLQGLGDSGVDVTLPADGNEAVEEEPDKILSKDVNPGERLGYTVEADGAFLPADGPYGGYILQKKKKKKKKKSNLKKKAFVK